MLLGAPRRPLAATAAQAPSSTLSLELDGKRYTCSAAGDAGSSAPVRPSCAAHVDGVRTLMKACTELHSMGNCLDRYGDALRPTSTCGYATLGLCMESCEAVHSKGACLDFCSPPPPP